MQVEAENFPDISLKYEVVAVPTFIFLKVTPFMSITVCMLYRYLPRYQVIVSW